VSGAIVDQLLVQLVDVDKEYINNKALEGEAQYKAALSNVSLRLGAGEFVFLTGPSGAGKSTLLKIVLGLLRPTRGQVQTLGKDLAKLNRWQLRKLRSSIGIIFQNHQLLERLNVADNVAVPLLASSLSRKEKRIRVQQSLEMVQMDVFAKQDVRVLSAGEKQRVGIARALVHQPKLILADEPTGNLDPVSARSLIRMLRELRCYQSSVLIATHDMELVRSFGGRVLEIVGGTCSSVLDKKYRKAYNVPQFWREEAARETEL